jgi:murein L,D-transpeptidase YafK
VGIGALRFYHRLLSPASIALAATAAFAGSETGVFAQGKGAEAGARALKPVPATLAAEIGKRKMPQKSPILIRVFKEESELEVWKQDARGKFALLKTYPICRWSGELGPKLKEGDGQSPEGFYTVTPGQMKPDSNYYLAFDVGFPNVYDRANDRTGSFLMVHGNCASVGCYAMTDEQIQEIYALARTSFLGGQKAFQVQAYPFRMTPLNMALHRNNPNMPFWRMLKEGNDHFEATGAEPHVDVCDKRYVFDARSLVKASTAPAFRPREKCPVYKIPEAMAAAVTAKEAADERAFADYVNRGVATVPAETSMGGGMHPVFLARLLDAAVALPMAEGVDLRALAAEACARHDGCTLDGEPVALRGDAGLLRLLMRHLLDHAQRHGVPPIRVELRRDGPLAALSVISAGEGIQPADEEAGRGTGLRFALVRQIARLHGGDAVVVAGPGARSALAIDFPIQDLPIQNLPIQNLPIQNLPIQDKPDGVVDAKK